LPNWRRNSPCPGKIHSCQKIFPSFPVKTWRHQAAWDGPLTLWYAQDTQFGAPRANVYLNLRSPAANGSPRNVVLTRLLTELVKDELNAFAYPARLADLDYSIYNHLRGITVKVSGYNDKLPQLLNEILTRLRHPTLASDAFRDSPEGSQG